MAGNPLSPSIRCPAPNLAPGAQGVARVAVDDANSKLTVMFLAPLTASQAKYLGNPLSYTLTGGQRLFPRILSATLPLQTSPPGPDAQSVVLTLDELGDFSIYTLTVNGPDIDPFFSCAKLRFRLGCDYPFDCATPATQSAPPPELPVSIDYLTKDYAGFRQALLDFIPTRLPSWTEQNEADIGMMLLELFAATADNLSYMQDRVANEAFLDTATQRRSVAAHLALIGYQMDDGASAYTWLAFQVNAPASLSAGFKVSNNPSAGDDPVLVFETASDAQLLPANNQMPLYDWGNSNCCLPKAALSTVLNGDFSSLTAGDYLIFDGGRDHRDVVRLTSDAQIVSAAQVSSPPSGSPPASPPGNVVVTVVNWSEDTPLSNDYCVDNTVVYGNVVLATHGETVQDEPLRKLSEQQITQVQADIAARPPGARVPRQRLQLTYAPLAHLDATTLALVANPASSRSSCFGRQLHGAHTPQHQHAETNRGWRSLEREGKSAGERPERSGFSRRNRRPGAGDGGLRRRRIWYASFRDLVRACDLPCRRRFQRQRKRRFADPGPARRRRIVAQLGQQSACGNRRTRPGIA